MYIYMLFILGSKHVVWFYIFMSMFGVVETPALQLITWIYIKYNIYIIYRHVYLKFANTCTRTELDNILKIL